MSKRINSSLRRQLVARRALGFLSEDKPAETAQPRAQDRARTVVRLPNGVRVVKAKA